MALLFADEEVANENGKITNEKSIFYGKAEDRG